MRFRRRKMPSLQWKPQPSLLRPPDLRVFAGMATELYAAYSEENEKKEKRSICVVRSGIESEAARQAALPTLATELAVRKRPTCFIVLKTQKRRKTTST